MDRRELATGVQGEMLQRGANRQIAEPTTLFLIETRILL